MANYSKYGVAMDYIAGERIYRVCRLIDKDKPDMSNNREYREGLFHSYYEAKMKAEQFNQEANNVR